MYWGVQNSHAVGAPKHPGDIIGPMRLAGFNVTPKTGDAGEIWTLAGNRGNLFMLTTDGFFVTELFRDCRLASNRGPAKAKRGMVIKNMSLGEECFWPSITQTADGNIYVVAGHPNTAIFRVVGLESAKRLPPMRVEVTAETQKLAARLIAGKAMAKKGRKTLKARVQGAGPAAWGKDDWVPIADGLVGALQVRGDRLHMTVRATSDKTVKNDYITNAAVADKLLFKGGGGMDLYLGTDPKAHPQRQAAVKGDVRLLVARRQDGRTKAMLYRQVFPGTQDPETFISPVKKIKMDRIDDVSEAVKLAVKATPKAVTYEFSVPLNVLGLKGPRPGMKVLGDIGVLRGNGVETAARYYWHNRMATFVSDIPGEAELDPTLWGWIEFTK
jgi:hypothetical protein